MTLDFLIGISVFLLTLAFVFLMAPSLFTPFDTSQPAAPLVSDRTADHLAQAVLVGGEPGADIDTDFFTSEEDLNEELQLKEYTRVNISIVEMESGVIAEKDGERLARGPTPPTESGQVTLSQRVVVVDGDKHWLHVKVW